MGELKIEEIADHMYRFQESGKTEVDSYLICGEEYAVVIDGLEYAKGLYEDVKSVTDKPLFMIVTHGHPDHIGRGMREFMEAGCTIYTPQTDFYMIEETYGDELCRECFRELTDGMLFELGGTSLRAMAMPGHTQGIIMLYMEREHVLFSTDAVGSGGIWMQLPHSSPLTLYQQELEKLLKFLKQEDATAEDGQVRIYVGHSAQLPDCLAPGQDYLTREYVQELYEMTKKIISGELVGEQIEIPMDIMKGICILQAHGHLVEDYTYDGEHIVTK